ncbi:aminoglycoside phosphotransferase family protein [Planococcus sp. CAU13]|uniref:aminoglycoside phosphotransferase family protein n=1 Tax=Planococcus sp. CAU13 TaxID=1541197 RepID=UPI00068D2207|nr:aminoglycoside phosphotransferase family protein [Planococcus sp. CAU13]
MDEPKDFIPLIVQLKAKSMGPKGELWLAEVKETLMELIKKWELRFVKTLSGGSEALVTEVRTKNREPAVLKLAMPQMEGNSVFDQELEALRIADGVGYVRLLKEDHSLKALLLERLGPLLKISGYSPRQEMEIICSALMKTWKPVPEQHALQTFDELIPWFIDFIPELWLELGKPCSVEIVTQALIYLEGRLAQRNPSKAVLLHGDAHNENILQDPEESQPSFKLIDPDGLLGEPAYDLGVLMREWPDELAVNPLAEGRKRCHFLSRMTGEDPQAIWEWGFIQCVSTGLLLIKTGREAEGVNMLEVATAWNGVRF